MATPYTNFVPHLIFDPALTGSGNYVASGNAWGTALATGVVLTYSFPGLNGTPYRDPGYSGNEWSGWSALDSRERAAVHTALATISKFANVDFVHTTDTISNVGELRFACSTTLGSGEAAHAYYPWSTPDGGDVWFNPRHFNADGGTVPRGSYDFLTILHEAGHAIGLKHSFEAPNAMPASKDSFLYSIMSYTASRWSADGDSYATFYPTTPMYYDLLALQAMYGVQAANTGNNVYKFLDGRKYWQTIHDTGGTDTIVYSGVENSSINLNPGSLSKLSEAIQFQRPNGVAVSSKATVSIGPGIIIENATGGAGSDVLAGNGARNVLTGGAGNDTLRGYGGSDYLRGGLGNDRLYGGVDGDYFTFNSAPSSLSNHDTVYDYNVALDTILIDNGVFARLGAAGALAAAFFRLASRAVDSNDFLVYHRSSGNLYYDDNGSRAGHETLVATFANKPMLTYEEFAVI